MNSSFCSISAPLLFLFFLLVVQTDSSIEKVCEKAMKKDITYEKLCATTLMSATNGKGDDSKLALSKVAMELANKTLNENMDKIVFLLKRNDLPELTNKAVQVCKKDYGAALVKMVQASQRFGLGDFDGTSDYLNNARDEVMSCTDAITVAGIESPLKEENENAMKLCFVAIRVEGTLT